MPSGKAGYSGALGCDRGPPRALAPGKADSPWLSARAALCGMLGRGHLAERAAVQFRLPGTWRHVVRDACVCVCGVCTHMCVCVCVLSLAELQSLSILELKTWGCQCFCPRRYFILEEKLSLVCSLYLG